MNKVSVIVPIYKVEHYLERCVDSLIGQTLQDIEIILVDDGSPDGCPAMCDAYARRDGRIRVIHKANEGVSAARNDGLSAATGEYIIFCDSDDWMEPDAFEILYKNAQEADADISIGDVYRVFGDVKEHAVFYAEDFVTSDRTFIDGMIRADIYRTYCPLPPSGGPAFGYGGPWNKLVRRSLLVDHEITFDVRLKGIFDDIIYTAYILAYAGKIVYVNRPVYNYRIVEDSITRSYKPDTLEINDAIFTCWKEFMDLMDTDGTFLLPFYACVMRRVGESMPLYYVNDKNEKSETQLQQEFKAMMKTEPYQTAVRNVDLSKLSKKQKLLAVMGRTGIVKPFWRLFK